MRIGGWPVNKVSADANPAQPAPHASNRIVLYYCVVCIAALPGPWTGNMGAAKGFPCKSTPNLACKTGGCSPARVLFNPDSKWTMKRERFCLLQAEPKNFSFLFGYSWPTMLECGRCRMVSSIRTQTATRMSELRVARAALQLWLGPLNLDIHSLTKVLARFRL